MQPTAHHEAFVWLNGTLIPQSAASVPLSDLGLWGLAVTEMLRTYGGRPFHATAHVERLLASGQATGIFCPEKTELLDALHQVLRANADMIAQAGDIGISMCVTAGHNQLLCDSAGGHDGTVALVPFPLPFTAWQTLFVAGQKLITSNVRPVPADCIDPDIKSRSRLHWRLAERDVQQTDPNAKPLLVDANGCVTETSTANILAAKDGSVLSPAPGGFLPGITRAFVLCLAMELGLNVRLVPLTVQDLQSADEVFLTSSLLGLCPVSHIDGQSLPHLRGPVFQQLAAAFANAVGGTAAPFFSSQE